MFVDCLMLLFAVIYDCVAEMFAVGYILIVQVYDPPSQPTAAAVPSVRPALLSPAHFTLLPPSAQYVCQPPVPLPAPYRLVGGHGQELPISGLTYQLLAPPQSHASVQLIPASAVTDVYPPSQHAAYLHAESTVHTADSDAVIQLRVDPKSAAAMYGPVDPAYHVIAPSAGDGAVSYAMPSGELSLPQPTHQAAASSRLYEDAPEYYPPQSTLLVTGSHPVLRQSVPVIISGETLS